LNEKVIESEFARLKYYLFKKIFNL